MKTEYGAYFADKFKQKLFNEWGERSTLYHASDKLIATLKAFDVLESSNQFF